MPVELLVISLFRVMLSVGLPHSQTFLFGILFMMYDDHSCGTVHNIDALRQVVLYVFAMLHLNELCYDTAKFR